MKNYLDLMKKILVTGNDKDDRTGTGTLSLFGETLRFDLSHGFPLVTTKAVHFKSVAYELLWFLKGSGHADFLEEHGISIWRSWYDENNDLGPVYPVQWRAWPDYYGRAPIDQVAGVINELKTNPSSRRLLVNAWNVGQLDEMALPPCHFAFQFYVNNGKLSCQVYQRSCDVFIGLPYNLASYALLTHMVAHVTDLMVGELIFCLGDTHLYKNHLEQARLQLEREPLSPPSIGLSPGITDIDDFQYGDIVLFNYNPHPAIKAPVAV